MSQLPEDDNRLYTLKEVARYFQCSERTVHYLLESGKLSGMLVARRWKFSRADIAAYESSVRRTEGKGAKKKRAYTRRAKEENGNAPS